MGRLHHPPRDKDVHQMSISFDSSRSYGSSAPMSLDSNKGIGFVAKNSHSSAVGGRISTTYEGSDDDYAPDFEPDDGYDSRTGANHPSKKVSRGGYDSKYDGVEESKSSSSSRRK